MSEWPIVPLSEISRGKGQYGVGLSSREWSEGDPRYVRITDIDDDGQLGRTKVAPDGREIDWEKALLKTGDLLFARSGATVGKTYLHSGDDPAVYAGYLIRFDLDRDRAVPNYVFRYTQSPDYRRWVENSQRAVAQPNINAQQYGALTIPLPPVEEQRRIAAILDHADALRAKRREALARLDELTQSIFIDMFGDPILNSREYPVQTLQELINPVRPITYGILKPGQDMGEEGVKYIRVVDMKNGEILAEGVRSTSHEIAESYRRSRLAPGDLLMSIRGHVGRTAIVPGSLDGANITQDTARLAIVGASTAYVRECISTAGFKRWLDRHTKGVAVRGINLGDVKEMPIPVPEPQQQEEFAQVVARVNLQRATVRESLSALEAEFASLQHDAFRGKL